jgi:hypothetical protein
LCSLCPSLLLKSNAHVGKPRKAEFSSFFGRCRLTCVIIPRLLCTAIEAYMARENSCHTSILLSVPISSASFALMMPSRPNTLSFGSVACARRAQDSTLLIPGRATGTRQDCPPRMAIVFILLESPLSCGNSISGVLFRVRISIFTRVFPKHAYTLRARTNP